jgi:hypothetical protein
LSFIPRQFKVSISSSECVDPTTTAAVTWDMGFPREGSSLTSKRHSAFDYRRLLLLHFLMLLFVATVNFKTNNRVKFANKIWFLFYSQNK